MTHNHLKQRLSTKAVKCSECADKRKRFAVIIVWDDMSVEVRCGGDLSRCKLEREGLGRVRYAERHPEGT